MARIYDFEAYRLDGSLEPLTNYKGKVLLIVNTASNCGFTPQYAGLEALYTTFKDEGFAVLGFPCNQFANQESGSKEDISTFCQVNYGVSFPMFDKIDVNGSNAHPLYVYLRKEAKGFLGSSAIKWNFTKFLVDQNGKVVKRYATATAPSDITNDISKLLRK